MQLHALNHEQYQCQQNKKGGSRYNDYDAPARIDFLLCHHSPVDDKGVGHGLLAESQRLKIPPPDQTKIVVLRFKGGIYLQGSCSLQAAEGVFVLSDKTVLQLDSSC